MKDNREEERLIVCRESDKTAAIKLFFITSPLVNAARGIKAITDGGSSQ